jgi:hypothetical protein
MTANTVGAGLLLARQASAANVTDPIVALEAYARQAIEQDIGINLGPYLLG